MKMDEIENVIAGLFLALFTALPRKTSETVLDTLCALSSDPGTSAYESKLYADLASSISEQRTPPPAWGVFERLATLH